MKVFLAIALFVLCALIIPSLSEEADTDRAWVCPMHADYTMDVAGKCPRCGMDLVKAAPFDVRDYKLDFKTVPAVVKPNQKIGMSFRISHPGTGDPVKKFETVHEKQFHLF